MSDPVEFSKDKLSAAIETAQFNSAKIQSRADAYSQSFALNPNQSNTTVLAQCLEVMIKDRQVCLVVPDIIRIIIGDTNLCIPVPIDYDGDVAKVCMSLCFTGPIPTGVEVTVSIAGIVIVKQVFGKC